MLVKPQSAMSLGYRRTQACADESAEVLKEDMPSFEVHLVVGGQRCSKEQPQPLGEIPQSKAGLWIRTQDRGGRA